jgi:hypothetical protein
MKAIYGLYPDPDSAQRAVDSLRATGLKDREITIVSAEPLEEYEFAHRDKQTVMTWIAAFGGLVGMISAYLLTTVTQQMWPINTGGMPIVSHWPNLIIIFELTMLGAVFATVITLLVAARLPGSAASIYDREVSNGKILIGVANPEDPNRIERALRSGGNATLKTIA